MLSPDFMCLFFKKLRALPRAVCSSTAQQLQQLPASYRGRSLIQNYYLCTFALIIFKKRPAPQKEVKISNWN